MKEEKIGACFSSTFNDRDILPRRSFDGVIYYEPLTDMVSGKSTYVRRLEADQQQASLLRKRNVCNWEESSVTGRISLSRHRDRMRGRRHGRKD